MFVQHRTPSIHWLLSTVTGLSLADCIGAATKLGSIIETTLCKLCGQQRQQRQQRQHLQQAKAIDAALIALSKNDVASAIQIVLVIDKIYTQCLGKRSLIKQLTPRALE